MNPDFLASAADVGPLGALPLTEGFGEDPRILGGEYLLLDRLGEGGMGEVHRAIQLSTRRVVAVKCMRAGSSDLRFEQEVRVLGRLRHPGIATLIQAGMHDGRPFLAMEYVAGGSLADRLAAGPLPPKEAARIVREAAEAIDHAHRAGIVHRDLKPANLLLEDDGRVRVTDFSVAKDLSAGRAVTLEGQALGTPAYMAPEQVDGEKGGVGPATDVHGLGATLFHALAGRPPFGGGNTAETVRLAASGMTDWRAGWKGVHRDLRTICMRAMHPVPGRRYPSAAELAADLGRFLDGLPVQARPISPAERMARWIGRPWPLATLAALAALAVGVLGTALFAGRVQRTRVDSLLRDWPRLHPQPIRVVNCSGGATGGLRASFTADGRLFAWGASDGHVRLGQVDPWVTIANSLKRTAPVRFHQFLPGTGFTNLFVAADDGLWRVWTAGRVRRVLGEGRAEGGVAAFEAWEDRRTFAVGAVSGEITGWKLDEGRCLPVFRAVTGERLVGMHRAAEPGRFLTVGESGSLGCWDLASERRLWGHGLGHGCTATAVSPDRETLAVGSGFDYATQRNKTSVRFLRCRDGTDAGAFTTSEMARGLVFSPDGTRLLVVFDHNQVTVWSRDGRQLYKTGAHPVPVAGGEFSPDGLRLLTWDRGGEARLWDAHTGEPLSAGWSGPGGIAQATFAPDGWRIGSGDFAPTGTLWDAGCPLPMGWDRTALTAALVRDGRLKALRRAVWLDPADPDLLRRLANVTRQQSSDPGGEVEAAFLERRAAVLEDRRPGRRAGGR